MRLSTDTNFTIKSDMTRFLDDIEALQSSFNSGIIWFTITLFFICFFIIMGIRGCKKDDDSGFGIAFLAFLFSGIPWIFYTVDIAKHMELSVGFAAENELVHNRAYVISKYDNPKYTDYAIRCGRFTSIYARIQKFPELHDHIYAVTLGDDEKCWINNSDAIYTIRDAINRYELYGK